MSHPKNILVTGGCGFIGSNYIRLLLGQGSPQDGLRLPHRVLNLDKLTYAGNRANLTDLEHDARYVFVEGDIGDAALVDGLLEKHGIEAVVHFAAETHVDRSIDTPAPFIETNIRGTWTLLESARQYWKKLAGPARDGFRFLNVSTDEVFGSLHENDPAFCETTPYAPNSPYSASKASSDFLVRSYFHTYGMPVLTTNCSNNYGPYQFPEKLIPLMILNALEGKDLPVYGDGRNIRDWLYVGDHARAVHRVLTSGRTGETYNVGGLCEMRNIDLVHTLCRRLDAARPRPDGKPYAEQIRFVTDRPGHDHRYAMDCRKIMGELGWKPLETFESGMEKTIQWYLTNAAWSTAINEKKYGRQRLGLIAGS
ncbi:MAG: dTDP-glucose 4,6-dehydratase [Verrucomicrobiae bacterium]|nr:dTDP-glucose 4,6-dehydratase [Verrucomicrobiae bacterium]